MNDWDDVVAFALALADTEFGTSYGRPAVKVNGKAFVYPGREQGSFAVASPLPEKELLMKQIPAPSGKLPIIAAGRRCSSATAVPIASGSRR